MVNIVQALTIKAKDEMTVHDQATNNNKIAIKLRNISKKFGNVSAVENLSLDIRQGEFLFFLGPSGSGKTTVLRMIGGYEEASSGSIEIAGREVTELSVHKRDIGMVFQNYALFPHKTVMENIVFGLKMRKVSKAEQKNLGQEVIDLVGLVGLADRYPRQLSGGQQQRVALARAIVYRPSVLLLDEPLANLDRKMRDNMRIELKKLQEKIGITTIFVTHDQEEALAMADRIAVMQDGRLMQIGTPDELYNKPKNSFVATFIGDTNFFKGTLSEVSKDFSKLVIKGMGELIIHTGNGYKVGQEMGVSIRPERVHLSAVNEFKNKGNLFSGTVEFLTYLGSSVMYLIRLPNDMILKVTHHITNDTVKFAINEKVFCYWSISGTTCVC